MYNDIQRQILLSIAEASIRQGLQHGEPLSPPVEEFDPELREERATFVTLNRQGDLRGCIGSLTAHQPLVVDVAQHAFDAAFRDPRFPPLSEQELAELEIHISVLSPAEPIDFKGEADLLEQLRPGIDGLIITEGTNRGTFLPSVWEQLPDKTDFLHHLKMKAGLPVHYWSDTLKVSRYTTESFGKTVLG